MPDVNVLGVSMYLIVLITIFWCIFVMVLLGPAIINDGTVATIVVFLALGTTLLVGRFGWQILIIPSFIILSAAGLLIWKIFNS